MFTFNKRMLLKGETMIDFTEDAEVLKIGSFTAKIEQFLDYTAQSENELANEWFYELYDEDGHIITFSNEYTREECIEQINSWISLLNK